MKFVNSIVITALLGLFILPACGSNHSDKQKDSANAEQSSTSGKEEVQQCPLGLMLIEEEISFEAILRDGKAWLRFPKSLREKIWEFYPIQDSHLSSTLPTTNTKSRGLQMSALRLCSSIKVSTGITRCFTSSKKMGQ